MDLKKSTFFRTVLSYLLISIALPLFITLTPFFIGSAPVVYSYDLDFSTYLGGSNWEFARDICVDKQGYIYVVGGTHSADFPTTPGAYDRTFDSSGTQVGSDGPLEAFISKFSPNGTLVWSTFLGGPNYDRAYAVEVDDQGYVYVAGRAGPGFPTSATSFQPNFQGWNQGGYGWQNAFVAKLSPDGSNLLWASYVGLSSMCRDIAIDQSGNIYLPLGYNNQGDPASLPAAWFSNAFQKTTKGGPDCGIIKISNDGTQVHWATWLGGSGKEGDASSVRVDDNGYVYIGFQTQSTDIPTTPGAFDRSFNGNTDYYVAKLSPDGSNLEFGTYLGGSGNEWHSTHNLAIDEFGNVYAAPWTDSPNYPTTAGACQESIAGRNDIAVTKLSPTGGMIASTFIGGSGAENPDGIYVDAAGNVYVSGTTGSNNWPVTADAYQSVNGGSNDAILLILSADFSQLLYSTYMGGGSHDNANSGFMDSQGNLYIAGSSNGTGWPTKNAVQDHFAGGGGGMIYGEGDVIVAKFSSNPSLSPGSLQFSAASYSVNENGGSVTITVTRIGGSSGKVTVDYTTNNGSALAGSDYTATSGTLSFSDGETSKSFTIQILDDTLNEGNETVSLTLNNPTGGATLGSTITAVLTIIDDEKVLYGDVNGDGKVNIQDVQACVNHILGTQDWGTRADVNGDGKVDEEDVNEIINIILK